MGQPTLARLELVQLVRLRVPPVTRVVPVGMGMGIIAITQAGINGGV